MKSKRHALGQHFLKDGQIIESIVSKAKEKLESGAVDFVLEIGPGKGALTFPLIQLMKSHPKLMPKLTVAEKDWNFIADWKGDPHLQVIEGDFLKIEWEKQLPSGQFGVVSNLPYSAGTGITLELCDHPSRISFMVLMFQAEVARRLRATHDDPEWGSLSLWVQNRWDVEKFLFVPPKSFIPPPKVDSEVIVFTPRSTPRIPGTETSSGLKLWDHLLRRAFMQKRKMLRSSIRKDPQWRNALDQSKVDDTKRSEALSWAEWEKLFSAALHQQS